MESLVNIFIARVIIISLHSYYHIKIFIVQCQNVSIHSLITIIKKLISKNTQNYSKKNSDYSKNNIKHRATHKVSQFLAQFSQAQTDVYHEI